MVFFGPTQCYQTLTDEQGRQELLINEFTEALDIIADVMKHGAASHPDNDWVRRTPEYHLARAEEHLRLLRNGDRKQNQLAHAATRLLMALTLQELA
jgi:hypothetical protein